MLKSFSFLMTFLLFLQVKAAEISESQKMLPYFSICYKQSDFFENIQKKAAEIVSHIDNSKIDFIGYPTTFLFQYNVPIEARDLKNNSESFKNLEFNQLLRLGTVKIVSDKKGSFNLIILFSKKTCQRLFNFCNLLAIYFSSAFGVSDIILQHDFGIFLGFVNLNNESNLEKINKALSGISLDAQKHLSLENVIGVSLSGISKDKNHEVFCVLS